VSEIAAVIAIAAAKSKRFEFPSMDQRMSKRAFCLLRVALQ
jgi:hypothetical protein